MENSIFQLCILLRHLDSDNDLTTSEKILLLDKLFALPNKNEWKMLVQASIYEPDCEKVFKFLQDKNVLQLLIQDLNNLQISTQHLSLLPKLARCFNSLEKTICSQIFKYCCDDEGQSIQTYITDVTCMPKPVNITPSYAFESITKHSRGSSMPSCNKLHTEIQRFISNSAFKEELNIPCYPKDFKINEYMTEGEREANSNIDMIDDELRALANINLKLSDPNLLGRLLLK
jgi:hypothetical protein